MGYAEILYIYENGIKDAYTSEGIDKIFIPEVGRAVLEAIHNGQMGFLPDLSTNIFTCPHCVNFVREIYSMDQKLFLWTANTLRPLGTLNTQDFALVKRLRKFILKGPNTATAQEEVVPEKAEILYLYDDAIRGAFTQGTIKSNYIQVVGQAVLEAIHLGKLSLKPASANIFNFFYSANFVREVRSLDSQLFLWAGNCLRALDQLKAEDLALVDHLIDEERQRRAARTPSRVSGLKTL